MEEQRKIALDEHLNFIVDQTEKMSSLVAESLMKSANNSSISTLQTPHPVITEGKYYTIIISSYFNNIIIDLIS